VKIVLWILCLGDERLSLEEDMLKCSKLTYLITKYFVRYRYGGGEVNKI